MLCLDCWPTDTGGRPCGPGVHDLGQVDLAGFLFGDILAVTGWIWRSSGAAVSLCWRHWPDLAILFAATVNYDLATAEGARPDFTNIVFMVLVAAVIAVSMACRCVADHRIADYPADSAAFRCLSRADGGYRRAHRGRVCRQPEGSLEWDTPAGPSIVVAALACFVLSLCPTPRVRSGVKAAKSESSDMSSEVSEP